jgi:predicted nuclease with TOPRIM domain
MGRSTEERPLEKALSDPLMQEFRERVAKLKQDRNRLLVEFQKIRSHIIDLYNDLEEQPQTAFHLSITDPNTQNFPLDPDSLGKVAVSYLAAVNEYY